MLNISQKEFAKRSLLSKGEVTRNQCLTQYISRLGAIMCQLKKEGWEFETFERDNIKPDGSKGKDFVYKLVSRPGQLPTREEMERDASPELLARSSTIFTP
jgi:hypothetical protein